MVDIAVAFLALIILVGVFGGIAAAVFGEYADFITWLYSRNWGMLRIFVTIIFIGIDIFLVTLFVHIWRRISELNRGIVLAEEQPVHTVTVREEIRNNWEDIRILANSPNASDWNMAVLRADAQLDDVLEHLGHEGPTLAERLKQADPTILKSIDRIWSAHRLRNAIAHDPTVQHPREAIIHALHSYEQAFKELGLMVSVENSSEISSSHMPPPILPGAEDFSFPSDASSLDRSSHIRELGRTISTEWEKGGQLDTQDTNKDEQKKREE